MGASDLQATVVLNQGTLVGAYRVQRQIGKGGMGAVWLAEHTMLGRRAALKMLHQEFTAIPGIVTRFFNEARAATAIADPGIVQIFDFGYHHDGSAYIVMELLDGESLDARLTRLGVFSVADAVRVMRQVASTLGAAHSANIVHRDLKPENVMIVRDPEVQGGERAKVLDFGIAKLASDNSNGVQTVASAVLGTPAYMSPEQCRGAGLVDARSDVYALGCVLFRLLCGRPPFQAAGMGELFAMHLREPPPVPSQVRPGLPREIDQLILRCLDKDPERRFASGRELASALEVLSTATPNIPVPPGPYAGPATPTTLSSSASANEARARRGQRRRLGLVIAASTGLAGVGAGTGLLVSRAHDNSTPAATPQPVVAPPVEMTPVGTPQSPPSASPPQVAPPQPATPQPATPPAPGPQPGPPPPAEEPDPAAGVASTMKVVLQHFVTWSRAHAGEPCPEIPVLAAPDDPWHHAFHLTCTDQPGNQIVGVISAGPDGAWNTNDDVASWQLGHDVTDLVRGPRWVVAPAKHPKHPVVDHATQSSPHPHPPIQHSGGTTGVELDENGLPITR
jgi:serine/threonine-protein kinase